MRLRTIIGLAAMGMSICMIGGAATAQEAAASAAQEEEDAVLGNQLFFRGAYSSLSNPSRGTEVFTDSLGAGVANDGKGGWSIAAGLDLSAWQLEDYGGANLMGEVFVEYSQFSKKNVVPATNTLLGLPGTSTVAVTELNVTVAPKARFDGLGNGRFRPFVIPIGLAFLVNSPPSDDATYLDIGLHFGGGVDVLVIDRISVGWDIRYTHGFQNTNTNTRYWSTGGYAALNF